MMRLGVGIEGQHFATNFLVGADELVGLCDTGTSL